MKNYLRNTLSRLEEDVLRSTLYSEVDEVYYTKKGKFNVKFINSIPYRELHRISGPALMLDTQEEWWQNGKRHRLDGYALIHRSGHVKQFWINGKKLNKEKVVNWIDKNNIDLKIKEGQIMFKLKFG